MSSEWHEYSVEEMAEVIGGGTPSTTRAEYFDGDIPWLTPKDLSGYKRKYISRGARNITQAGLQRSGAKLMPAGTVLLTSRAPVGYLAIASNPISTNQGFKSLVPKEGFDSDFLYYLLKLNVEFLKSQATGTTFGELSGSALKRLRFSVPDIDRQRNIARMLGALDDKIELNRWMNETLEEMARALFKCWFVDFEPVRMKAEGKDPSAPISQGGLGLDPENAALFPDSFEDSELGNIPAGWRVCHLGEIIQQRVERCAPSAESMAMPYVPIDCISSKSLFLSEAKLGEEAQSSLTRFHKGDILFGAMRPYFHKVCIAPFDGTTRTTAFVLIPKAESDFAFVTLLLHDQKTIDYATQNSTGSTIPYAVWEGSLANMKICLPPPEVRALFGNVAGQMLSHIPRQYLATKTLVELRDALLPRLMSGSLKVVG